MGIVVFYDVFELGPGHGKSKGIYNYAKNLFIELVKSSEKYNIHWHVACNGSCVNDFSINHKNVNVHVYDNKFPGKIKRQQWKTYMAAIRLHQSKANVYFSPKGFLPKLIKNICPKAKSLVTVHDLIPLWYKENYPGYFGTLEEYIVANEFKNTAKNANHIIAISHATANELKVKLDRTNDLHVIYNGVVCIQPTKVDFSKPFIFAVSSSLLHKNGIGIVNAYNKYRELTKNPLPLVLCGFEVKNSIGITSVFGLSDSEIHWYYANAELFLFLSLIEGFGFPPIEALINGTQVICSQIPALMEVTAGKAHYVDPMNQQQVAQKMVDILSDVNNPVDEVNFQNIYSWEKCANETLNLILKI